MERGPRRQRLRPLRSRRFVFNNATTMTHSRIGMMPCCLSLRPKMVPRQIDQRPADLSGRQPSEILEKRQKTALAQETAREGEAPAETPIDNGQAGSAGASPSRFAFAMGSPARRELRPPVQMTHLVIEAATVPHVRVGRRSTPPCRLRWIRTAARQPPPCLRRRAAHPVRPGQLVFAGRATQRVSR